MACTHISDFGLIFILIWSSSENSHLIENYLAINAVVLHHYFPLVIVDPVVRAIENVVFAHLSCHTWDRARYQGDFLSARKRNL